MAFYQGNSTSKSDSRRTISRLVLDSKLVNDLWEKQWEWIRRQLENWAREVKEVLDAQPLKVRKRDIIFLVRENSELTIPVQFKPLTVNTVAAWEVDAGGKEIERISIGATDWYFETNQNNDQYLIKIRGVSGLNDGNRYKLVIDIEE